MNDPQLTPVSRDVNSILHDFNITKAMDNKLTRKLIMIAGYEHHAAAFAGTLEKFLHNVVVRLWPIPFAAQLPAVNDVADQVQVVARMHF